MGFTYGECQAARALVSTLIIRCERMEGKFPRGSSQSSLIGNRLSALHIGATLLTGDSVGGIYTQEELKAAQAPIRSILQKCSKAQGKHSPKTPNFKRYVGIVQAMEMIGMLLEEALASEKGDVFSGDVSDSHAVWGEVLPAPPVNSSENDL